ncbi:hypothetical protein DSECCO2_570710 [anaerobic digester metagenome]
MVPLNSIAVCFRHFSNGSAGKSVIGIFSTGQIPGVFLIISRHRIEEPEVFCFKIRERALVHVPERHGFGFAQVGKQCFRFDQVLVNVFEITDQPASPSVKSVEVRSGTAFGFPVCFIQRGHQFQRVGYLESGEPGGKILHRKNGWRPHR